MYENIDLIPRTCNVDTHRWEQSMFQLENPPPALDSWQDYIDTAKQDGDSNAFLVFLHYYEPKVNAAVNRFISRYGLEGNFGDLKLIYVETLWELLESYETESGVSFLIYAKRPITNALHRYGALNLKGFSVTADRYYYQLRTAAYCYKSVCNENRQEAIPMICGKLNIQEATAVRLLQEVIMLDTFQWYDAETEADPHEDSASEDNEIPHGRDIANFHKPFLPEPALLRKEMRKCIRSAFHAQSYQDQDIVSRHLGFYKVCFRPLYSMSFEDLADLYQYSTADGVRKAYHRALEKIRKAMEQQGMMESVDVKQIRKTSTQWQYEYTPNGIGMPGIIQLTINAGQPMAYEIVKAAEEDTDGHFAYETYLMICRLARKSTVPRKDTLILRDGNPLPKSCR